MTPASRTIIPIAIVRMNAFPVLGIRSVWTLVPAASWTSPPPTRNSPRIRAMAKEMAANTAANPRKLTAGMKWLRAAIVLAEPPVSTAFARMMPRMAPTGKAIKAIASMGAQSARPARWGRFGPSPLVVSSTSN
jgi:hypothetical protein